MYEIRKTEVYSRWLDRINDIQARSRVLARIERLALGNAGDVKPVGEGVSELRIDYGPGYRVYFTIRGRAVVILLAGGNKRTQSCRHQDRNAPCPQSIGAYNEKNNYYPLRCC